MSSVTDTVEHGSYQGINCRQQRPCTTVEDDPKPSFAQVQGSSSIFSATICFGYGGLFDHLIGKREHLARHVELHRLGGLEVEDQIVPGGRL